MPDTWQQDSGADNEGGSVTCARLAREPKSAQIEAEWAQTGTNRV